MNKQTPHIFDIQRFSIHDGPGIRSVLFTKGCPLGCLWCQNPESQKSKAEVAYYFESCTQCNVCVEVCPEDAIDPISKISDYENCTACGICVDTCENNARRMIGKTIGIEEAAEELLKDIDFYEDSNGGVTFSGGEPFLYPEYLLEIAIKLKERNVHINVETSGQFNYEKTKPIFAFIDSIFFDIKQLDNEKHKAYTGVYNTQLIQNFKKLHADFHSITPRVPLIPGFNDDDESLTQIAIFLQSLNHNEVHLLPFHSMGNSKAKRIDHNKPLFEAQIHTKEDKERIVRLFNQMNMNVILY